ncbi:MAG TPA: CPBP family intramembrane glutamic endopeptidase [Thermoanaerobaculia bacterium]
MTSAPGRLYRLAWGLYLVMAVGGVVWIGLRRGVIPLSLFFDLRTWWLDLLLGVGAALLLLGAWIGAERTVPLARDLDRQIMAALGPIQPGEAVALAVLSGFAEELFFRGAVQGAIGWLPATLAFAVLHSGPGKAFRLWTLFAAIAGLVFAGLVVWRGNLLAPIVGHFLVNAVNLGRLARGHGDSGRLPQGQPESEKES